MKNIIKKGLILLLINLIVPTAVLSQITLNATEAKTTSIIFAEHEKLSIENPLLKYQIQSLDSLNKLYIQSDSIQKKELKICKDKISSDAKTIKKLKTGLYIGPIASGIILFIIGVIL